MARKRKKPIYEKVTIEDIGAEGKAVTRVGDMVVFTKMAVPGDVVDLQVTKKRKKYQEAFVKNIHEFSTERQKPFCEHFGTCGGCKWQLLSYEKQLYYKQKQVQDQLNRIGKVQFPPVNSILGSEKNRFYRNKLEFTFSNKRWLSFAEFDSNTKIDQPNALGFHVPGMYDKVLHISKCWLQSEPSNKIRNFIYDYALKNKLDFFDIRNQTGFLRTLIIRTATTGETMVVISFFRENEIERVQLLDAIKSEFSGITSLLYVINTKGNDTITDQKIEVFSGRGFILEKMGDLKFKIGPKSFYQTNPEQANRLYQVVKDFANLNGREVVYDLYTGTGTIANYIARSAKKVIGIEYVQEAIADARENSKINQVKNTTFFAGDIKEVLTDEFVSSNEKPDVIITDPPRAGMHDKVVQAILRVNAERIVYVSCNPATQARDLHLLCESYRIDKVQPVDMFPHTHHVENVVLLKKKLNST